MSNTYPPYESLFKVIRDIPTSALLYMQLWNNRGHKNLITVHIKDVRSQYNTELPKFRRDLTKLNKGEYITYMEDKQGVFYIEFPQLEVDGKGFMPC